MSDPESAIACMKEWARERLPQLNESAFNGSLHSEGLAAIISSELLSKLPPASALHSRQDWQVLTILGCCGSSVERHAQQACVRRGDAAVPGAGLSRLRVRGGRHGFVEYFRQVADLVGHPYRDTFTTFVECNRPSIRVLHPETGEVAHSLPAAFDDGSYITFSASIEERQFILLLKECAALQGAANLFLEKLQDASLPLEDRTATEAALHAATLLLAIRAKLHEFMANSRFSADFFLDVLRQYACVWSASDRLRPPSGANDASALQRDVMLFNELIPARADFPGFRSHVKTTFPVLTEQARRRIERAMAAPSIEQRLLERLGRAENVLAAEQWLAAYVFLFEAQAHVSHTHYATVLKYLVRPKQIRDRYADPRERITVVANTHGTTGMDPSGIMRDLDRARANHFLHNIAHRGKSQVRRQLESWNVRRRSHSELLTLCKAGRDRCTLID